MKLHLLPLLIILPSAALAQEWNLDAAIKVGSDVLDQGLNTFGYEVDRELLAAIPQGADLAGFWRNADRLLEGESVTDLAWLRPEVEATLGYLEKWPAASPYADWLRQQLDYFAVAEEVANAEPTLPHRITSTNRPPRPMVMPSPAPTSAPPAQVVVRKRADTRACTAAVWRKRVKDRPKPKGADHLIPLLKTVFREERIPEQLVWLAEVESTLDPLARNPVGAAGLFQFMPPTAQRFGLSTERPDDRLDAEKSARAAATYLRLLHRRFGSWPLALAGYNAGEGRVGKLLARTGGKTFESIADKLPAETQMYVPKLSAILELRERVELSRLPPPG